MQDGNIAFGNITEKLNILSMTDITGFGLANHLLNLIKRRKCVDILKIIMQTHTFTQHPMSTYTSTKTPDAG